MLNCPACSFILRNGFPGGELTNADNCIHYCKEDSNLEISIYFNHPEEVRSIFIYKNKLRISSYLEGYKVTTIHTFNDHDDYKFLSEVKFESDLKKLYDILNFTLFYS